MWFCSIQILRVCCEETCSKAHYEMVFEREFLSTWSKSFFSSSSHIIYFIGAIVRYFPLVCSHSILQIWPLRSKTVLYLYYFDKPGQQAGVNGLSMAKVELPHGSYPMGAAPWDTIHTVSTPMQMYTCPTFGNTQVAFSRNSLMMRRNSRLSRLVCSA